MSTRRHHPIFWAMIGIPTAAVLASFYTLYLAMSGSEPELPPQYVSEGKALDADFARAQRAIEADISIRLDWVRDAQPPHIEAQYRSGAGASAPATLTLHLTHATLPSLDQQLVLKRVGETSAYRTEVGSLPKGHWLVEVSADDWRLRGRLDSSIGNVLLGANDGG